MLHRLGLNADAESVYRVMLRRPRAGTAEIADALGWPPERVAATLDELARLALVRPSMEEPDKVRLVNPKAGLETLLLRQEQEFLEQQQAMTDARLTVTSMLAEYGAAEAETVDAQRFTGRDAIGSEIERCAHNAKSEILVFAPRGGQSTSALDAARPLDRSALSRGVTVRYVYLDSLRNDAPTLAYARWLKENGAQVRVVPQLPLRMIIFDRRTAIVPLDPEDGLKGILVLNGTGAVTALCALFDQTWRGARPLGEERTPRADGLSAQDRAVLELLLAGYTDEAVARKLGISVRTGRRITADLMNRLRARSRFQAGALATAYGWLNPDHIAADDAGP
ncbi:LuxR C-terminal-related transcriptional regulator [Streptomyces sp. MST-110588]|uniref:LuxR C-terminal-related transcriptional regulator n=1 Tax=Streptomyces sp. MST-110588 TaxID=2833628 RepID=UPI001F5CA25E|nr:LuxR C-terminal-related transcriptional regulator [Streptomyces sp. MST-110588]UNO41616.1 hypothetical protein KGS77_21275 [Streptomyces sp. MST-110588]